MKKVIFILLFTLFSSNAFTIQKSNLCNFNGILGDSANRTEEFEMLLEPDNHPNYQMMADVVAKLGIAFEKELKNLDPQCASIQYVKELLAFYNDPINKKRLETKHYVVSQIIMALQKIMEENCLYNPTTN